MATLNNYYNRFDPAKDYDSHAFRAGYVLQSAEMNEIQSATQHRFQMMGDALFKDGDVIRDARIVVDASNGRVICESGAIYLRGVVRGVAPAEIIVPLDRTVAVGIWLVEDVVTEVEDPDLRDPASETRAYQEPGAARLRVAPVWGFDQGGTEGQFFPVYYVDNGQLRAKEAPPAMDSVSQALARYDRDSAGSNYVVSGLRVSMLPETESGDQVYNVEDGRARVNGYGVPLSASRRVIYQATPDIREIDSEPHTSSGPEAQRVNVDRVPIQAITQVRITSEQTATITHGSYAGAQDPLPETAVVDILEVKQAGTTYVKGTDYKLTAGRVDWSLSGAEPSPGSSYTAKFQFIKSVEPTEVDDDGFTVSTAVAGTVIFVSYRVKLPRIDRLCLNEGGEYVWFQGVATDYNPVPPLLPDNVCPLAQVQQTWTDDRRVVNDGVRVVPMSDIEAMHARMDAITDLVAQQKLLSDMSSRESAARKGMFVDPFLDDNLRDAGISQSAAVVNGVLTLPIDGGALRPSADILSDAVCQFTLVEVLSQSARTGGMKVNPYMAFAVPPSPTELIPSFDRWTDIVTEWTSPVTQAFVVGSGIVWGVSSSTAVNVTKTQTVPLQHLRQIEVSFKLNGFGPGETIASLTFDGVPVTPVAI